jgi:hypothetical protein
MIELRGCYGLNVTGYTLAIYNYAGGQSTTFPLEGQLTLTPFDSGDGWGYYVLTAPFGDVPYENGFGLALVNSSGGVVEFLCFGLTSALTVSSGLAKGATCTLVPAIETSYTQSTYSLQYSENGFWAGPYTSSFGFLNAYQSAPVSGLCATYTPPSPPSPANNAYISEVQEDGG